MDFKHKNLIRIGIVVGLILLIPLVLTIRDGGVEGVGWNWTLRDFIFMGSLLFVTGLVIDLSARKITNPVYRAIVLLSIVLAFLALWTELAVDAVSRFIALMLR